MGLRRFAKRLIGSLSLFSIMLISEQIITKNLRRRSSNGESDDHFVEVTDILTLEEWAKRVESEDIPLGHTPGSIEGESKI